MRACDRGEFVVEQFFGREARKVSPTVADCHIYRTTAEIHRVVGSVEPQVHAGIGSREGRGTWHKPARHECAGRRKRHDRTRSSLVQARNRLGERVETVAQHEIEPLPLWGQQYKSRLPSKEPETDPVLKQPNL